MKSAGRAGSAAAAVLVSLLFAAPQSAQPIEPNVFVWYRGMPAGVPRQDDLAVIRAHGFAGVIWPERHASALPVVERMAAIVDLRVRTRAESTPITAESALMPALAVDVSVGSTTAPIAPALSWRAIAHGARQLAYDAETQTGSGLVDADGVPQRWVAGAASLARQLTFNRRLIDALRSGPLTTFEGVRPPGLDVALLDAGRSWVLVATNASSQEANAVVRLPPGVPPALWLELQDGSSISMLNQREGPRWTLTLGPGEARVYAIDKTSGTTGTTGTTGTRNALAQAIFF